MKENNNIKLSIITICYNEEKRIEKTIQSVIRQTYPNIEYIVIDGKSTDSTLSIINKYEKKIDLLISEEDSGIFHAQNKGLEKATGDYILLLNGGDHLAYDDVIEKVFASSTQADIIYGDVIFELSGNKKYRKPSPEEITALNMFVESIPHPSTFYKSSIFEKTGEFDTKYKLSADYDLLLKCIFELGLSSQYVPVPVAVFNLFGVSSDNHNMKLYLSERRDIQQNYLPEIQLKLMKIFKPFIIFIRKKLYYAYYFVKSRVFKNYMSAYE